MLRLSFEAIESFTTRTLHKWELFCLLDDKSKIDHYRREYLAMLEGMGWTETEHDNEVLKLIDQEWRNIYRRAFSRLSPYHFIN